MSAFGLPAFAFPPCGRGGQVWALLPKAAHAVQSLVRETDLRDRVPPEGLPFVQASIGEEAGDLSGSVEERDAYIMIFQHPDRRLGEVVAVPACRDLEDEAIISDRIVSPRMTRIPRLSAGERE
jgi:hypothetical protein